MNEREFRKLYPYRVIAGDLTDVEIYNLRRDLDADTEIKKRVHTDRGILSDESLN